MDGESIVIVGGDALALRVCAELAGATHRVTVIWDRDQDLAARVARCGASFVSRTGDEREALAAAGILAASVVICLSENDHLNLQFALLARDENPSIRIVLRQFNRTLGRKVQDNLHNSAVISLSSHAAATYAAAAMDPACYYGVQFPDIDGPLAGFFIRTAGAAGVSACLPSEAERRLGARLVAVGDSPDVDPERPLDEEDLLTLFAPVRPLLAPAQSQARRRTPLARRVVTALRHVDPVSRGALVAALIVFALGTVFFARVLSVDLLTSAYFTVTTMTTTGYGDITPHDTQGRIGAVALMLAGLAFSGIFIAVLSSMFTQARYDAVQGLRRVTTGGHVIVCGGGNVGSRVLEFLLRLGCRVVVVELAPRPEIIEGSRERRYELLTGDAAKDATLDLCNIEGAAALVALTNSDTMNLEVGLGARARNASLPIVMRVQEETFERSVRQHFGFERTFGTAALAAPAIADLALSGGARGRVAVGRTEYAIVELGEREGSAQPPAPACIPLAVWRDERLELIASFADARPHERVLFLRPPPEVSAPRVSEGAGT